MAGLLCDQSGSQGAFEKKTGILQEADITFYAGAASDYPPFF
jgi:hypothetical protein